jgi:nucleoid-associated protein YgaU
MPIALHDLYAPISEFFLTKFGTSPGAEVAFRFDKFGSVLTDADFIDETHPERGLQPALAMEKFSDLVNRVPIDSGDGASVVLTQAAIDDIYYYRLLAPSVPALSSGANDATRASVTAVFEAAKAEAVREWSRLTLQSSSGLMLSFKPSVAQPENWYDPAATQAWTNETFHIESTTSTPSPPLFRLRLRDDVLVEKLGLEPKVVLDRTHLAVAIAAPAAVPLAGPATPAAALANGAALTASPMLTRRAAPDVTMAPIRNDDGNVDGPVRRPEPDADLHRTILTQMNTMRFDERVVVNRRLREFAPEAPVTASSVSISFDYCLVNIQRPWWMDVFLNSGNWSVPGVPAGEVTSGDHPGSVAWLPVGFVAVRNLTISGSWSAEDSANLGQATDFGPFQVEAPGGQTLTHPGLQVVAWLLQQLPALPPADGAFSTPTEPRPTPAPRTYTVVAGDTLSKIARTFYGDARRFPEIQHANGIADPSKIYVGQILTIP